MILNKPAPDRRRNQSQLTHQFGKLLRIQGLRAIGKGFVRAVVDLDQKSVAEISALTGWNQTLVKVRAFRARRKLQRFYRELTESERS